MSSFSPLSQYIVVKLSYEAHAVMNVAFYFEINYNLGMHEDYIQPIKSTDSYAEFLFCNFYMIY